MATNATICNVLNVVQCLKVIIFAKESPVTAKP